MNMPLAQVQELQAQLGQLASARSSAAPESVGPAEDQAAAAGAGSEAALFEEVSKVLAQIDEEKAAAQPAVAQWAAEVKAKGKEGKSVSLKSLQRIVQLCHAQALQHPVAVPFLAAGPSSELLTLLQL